jgi:hypothetical protein
MSIYQSSTKALEVKEEAVQPCTKEKDYPSAEDRTADNRTTINNSTCEASPVKGEKLATLNEEPPLSVSRRVKGGVGKCRGSTNFDGLPRG